MFLQNFWDLTEGALFQFFKEFHANGEVVGEMVVSFFALILKMEGAITIRDFRPISLIRSLYKILAKVLANCFRKVLPVIISETQSAFVDGRQILDSALIAHECNDSRTRKEVSGVVCKLDFEKAYDMVDCNFLDYMLDCMVFGIKWRCWIYNFVSLARFSVLVNGSPKGFFSKF